MFKPQLLQLYSVTPGYKLTPYTSIGKRIVCQGEVGFVMKTVYDLRPPTYLPVPSLYKPHPPNVSSTPPVYQDLAEVFHKDLVLFFLPHRPYDCAIDLLPSAPLPTCKL